VARYSLRSSPLCGGCHYAMTRDEQLRAKRVWRERNPEKWKATANAWLKSNPERRRRTAQRWIAKNRERHNGYSARYWDALADSVVLKTLGLNWAPPELVAAKRAHLKLLRLIHERKKAHT
jgi:hypothetical protein